MIRWAMSPPRVDVLNRARLEIGRGDDRDISLRVDGVSRRHAELYRQGPIYALRDMGSTNGTFLNAVKVTHAPVAAGDVLRVGDCVGVFAHVDDSLAIRGFSELWSGLWGGAELFDALAGAREAARSGLTISLVGATGTGKECVARALHDWSGRAGPFYAINCAAVPAMLAEAELFGSRKGAFTGASQDSIGHLRAADRGTLFLDEAADLPLEVQAKLLRVLEQGEASPVGDVRRYSLDLNIVAAFQSSTSALVQAGRLRADFAARLSGFTIELPALKQRRADIPLLFKQFLRSHAAGREPQVGATLLESLCLFDWPENVRQLELLARRLLVLHGLERELTRRHLRGLIPLPDPPAPTTLPPQAPIEERDTHDLQRLIRALRESGGQVKLAAAQAGVSRQRAYRLMNGRSVKDLINEPDTKP